VRKDVLMWEVPLIMDARVKPAHDAETVVRAFGLRFNCQTAVIPGRERLASEPGIQTHAPCLRLDSGFGAFRAAPE